MVACSNKEEKKESEYLSDNYCDKEEDIFPERRDIAEKLSKSIKTIDGSNSYSIGIVSPWGNGKTTFLKYLLRKIKKEDPKAIFIEFSPWFCKSEIDIISLFFNSLSDGLRNYHSSIDNRIREYSKLLLTIKNNDLSKAISKGVDIFDKPKEIHCAYEALNTCVKDLNRKIYVSIDDLDRLYPKEIIECFKIIRNTANFENLIFIVTYSSDYVSNALREELKVNSNGYIDKIIQLEYELPEIEPIDLIRFLEDNMRKKSIQESEIGKVFHAKIEKNPSTSVNNPKPYLILELENYFENVRDCVRTLNNFFMVRNVLDQDCTDGKLFLICILKTLYPAEALRIYLNIDKCLRFIGGRTLLKDLDESANHGRKALGQTVKPRYYIEEINPNKTFLNLVKAIFYRTDEGINSITFGRNFETYYNGSISSDKVRYSEYQDWIKSPESILNRIKELKEEKNYNDKDKSKHLDFILSNYKLNDEEQELSRLYGLLYSKEIKGGELPQVLTNNLNFEFIERVIVNPLKISLQKISQVIGEYKISILDSTEEKEERSEFKRFHELSLKVLERKIGRSFVDQELIYIYSNCFIKRFDDKLLADPRANKLIREFIDSDELTLFADFVDGEMHTKAVCVDFFMLVDQIYSDEIGNYNLFENILNKILQEHPNDGIVKIVFNSWQQFKDSGYSSNFKNRSLISQN